MRSAGALLRPLELPARADAGPSPAIRAYAAVRNASILESTGRDDDALSAESLLPSLYSNADRERRQWGIDLDGDLVGCCALDISHDDAGETAVVTVAVLHRAAGQRIGSAAYAYVESVAREAGVRKLLHWCEHHDEHGAAFPPLASPTGFGSVPADRPARFLTRNGFRLEQVERASALTWSTATRAHLEVLQADAAAHAAGYRVLRWSIPTPEAYVAGYAWMKSRMSTDVPDGDVGTPEEEWDEERVRRQEERITRRGWSMRVTAAQHVGTGELCAFNELAIGPDASGSTHQYDTLVLAAHRGHRLGMLVKTAGLLAWRDEHPESPKVITYNAEENRPMLSINEAIGFAPIAYEGVWRKDLT
ncbi:GNAT family N-acetyltransferase [Microbacterium sp. NPDC058342]|uniref:GNAT family N-acetyltransferase n=1 Tax=Microbacterium sp. NPDC058342 TaxID=3346454 RepID=UPI0036578360